MENVMEYEMGWDWMGRGGVGWDDMGWDRTDTEHYTLDAAER